MADELWCVMEGPEARVLFVAGCKRTAQEYVDWAKSAPHAGSSLFVNTIPLLGDADLGEKCEALVMVAQVSNRYRSAPAVRERKLRFWSGFPHVLVSNEPCRLYEHASELGHIVNVRAGGTDHALVREAFAFTLGALGADFDCIVNDLRKLEGNERITSLKGPDHAAEDPS